MRANNVNDLFNFSTKSNTHSTVGNKNSLINWCVNFNLMTYLSCVSVSPKDQKQNHSKCDSTKWISSICDDMFTLMSCKNLLNEIPRLSWLVNIHKHQATLRIRRQLIWEHFHLNTTKSTAHAIKIAIKRKIPLHSHGDRQSDGFDALVLTNNYL